MMELENRFVFQYQTFTEYFEKCKFVIPTSPFSSVLVESSLLVLTMNLSSLLPILHWSSTVHVPPAADIQIRDYFYISSNDHALENILHKLLQFLNSSNTSESYAHAENISCILRQMIPVT